MLSREIRTRIPPWAVHLQQIILIQDRICFVCVWSEHEVHVAVCLLSGFTLINWPLGPVSSLIAVAIYPYQGFLLHLRQVLILADHTVDRFHSNLWKSRPGAVLGSSADGLLGWFGKKNTKKKPCIQGLSGSSKTNLSWINEVVLRLSWPGLRGNKSQLGFHR